MGELQESTALGNGFRHALRNCRHAFWELMKLSLITKVSITHFNSIPVGIRPIEIGLLELGLSNNVLVKGIKAKALKYNLGAQAQLLCDFTDAKAFGSQIPDPNIEERMGIHWDRKLLHP